MSGGADIEADVGLEVDGGPVFRAFDQIVSRMQEIQGQVDQITSKAKAAAEAFGGTGLKTLQDFNKVISTLERFQTNLQKNDPLGQRFDTALAAQARQNRPVEQQAAQEAAMWAKIDRDRYAEQSKLNTQLEREELAREQEVQRIREQNELKILRDQKQLTVQQADGIKELEAMQVASANRIAELRRVRDTGSPEAERTALQLLAIEKQQLATVTARIAEEQKAAISPVATRVTAQMDSRAAKLDETANLSNASLSEAQARVAALQAQIAVNTERAHVASEAERAEIEKMLVLDRERLTIADRQVLSLERQAQKSATPLPGLLGKNGIAGVFAFSAAYGAAASVIYGVVSTIKSGIDEAIKFNDTLDKIGAVADLSSTQIGEVGLSIEKVAENSKFARQEIADTALVLAQAGYSARDITESLGALNQLAEATGSDLKEVTDIVTSAIGAFQLSAQDTSRISNELAAALNGTRLNLKEVSTGIASAGEIAVEQNQSFEDFTANLTAMATAGLKGQQLGMGYRQVLIQLATPSKALVEELKRLGLGFDDINVKTLGMTGVINNLTRAGFTSADAFKVFGARASAAFLAMRDGQETALRTAQALSEHRAAAEGAAKSMESLSSQWQRLKNNVNDGTTNGLQPATSALAGFLKMINEMSDDGTAKKLEDNIQTALEASGGKTTEAVQAARDALHAYGEEKQQIIAIDDQYAKKNEEVETAVNKASEATAHEQQTLNELDNALVSVSVRKQVLVKDSSALAAETLSLEQQFSGLAEMLQNVALNYDNLTKAMMTYRQNQISAFSLQESLGMQAAQGSVNNFASQGSQYLHLLHQQPFFSSLPKALQDAVKDVQTSKRSDGTIDPTVRSQGITIIQNYLDGGKLPTGANNILGRYIGAAGNLGLSIGQYDQHRLNRDTANVLAQPEYSAIYSNIVTTDDRGALKGIATNLNNRLKNARGPAAEAIIQLLKMIDSKQGLKELPSPKTTAKAHNIANRQASAEDSEALKVDQMTLRNAIKDLLKTGGSSKDLTIVKDRTLSTEQMKTNLQAVSDDLDQWEADRRKQFEDELKRLKIDPSSSRGQEMQRLLDDEIKQKRQEIAQQVGAEITKAMQKMVEAVTEIAKMASDAAQHEQNMAQARVTALSRLSYQYGGAGVPDYVQQTYERQAAQAKDHADQTQIGINQSKIAGLQNAFDKGSTMLDLAQMFGLDDNAGDQAAEKALRDLHDQIVELTRANDELKASFDGGLIPQSFNQKLEMAIQNYKQVNHLQASWTDMIASDLTGALSAGQGAFEQFFQGILSGNATLAQSFGGLAKAVIGYLSQMMAKMMAMKVMEMLLNIFGGGMNAGQAAADASESAAHTSTVLSGLGFGRLHGGIIHALTGRYVTDGVSNRDSVPAMIAKGEYVVQKSAVDSVGVDFMDKLNNRGLSALGGFGPKVVLPQPANQKMSVFIVPPDQKPTMGPQDVLVTIADDIWRGGMTKTLIKEVAQGA